MRSNHHSPHQTWRREEGREKRQGGSKRGVRGLSSAYSHPHPSCLLVHPPSLFLLGGFYLRFCFFHDCLYWRIHIYLCICTYQLCNNYVTYNVAKHDSNLCQYQVHGMVCSTDFICSCIYYTLVCTQLLTISHMISIDIVSHKQLIWHACTPHCVLHFSFSDLSIITLEPLRSRRLVEHVGEMSFLTF